MATSITRGYSFGVEDNVGPVAIITPATQVSVLGSVVKMDGRASFDADGMPAGVLTYSWSFLRFPIGSQVEQEGFVELDPDGAVVSFAPDITGFYEVGLVVNDGTVDSAIAVGSTDINLLIVPNNRGLVPDASWIWNYLSDFWNIVEDKERFEVLWSAAIQITAAELLKLYQYDYNKSIRDIQTVFQKRWIQYSSGLEFDSTLVAGILADDQAGLEGATLPIDSDTGIVLEDSPDFFNLVTTPLVDGSFVETPAGLPISAGRLLTIAGKSYTLARSNNSIKGVNEGDDGATSVGSDVFLGSGFVADQVGLILRVLSGDDAGDYLIDSVATGDTEATLTDLLGGAVAFTSTATDLNYSVIPTSDNLSNFFSDVKDIPTDTAGQAWRFSSTIITTEFDLELQGVSVGDVLEVEIVRQDLNLAAVIRFQVVGVDRGRLSFVFNLDDLVDGTAASGLSEQAQLDLAETLQVTGLERDVNGVLQYALEAEAVRDVLVSNLFRSTNFETELNTETEIDLGAFVIKVRPVQVIRNTKIAVDPEILSIPLLQEFIRQPELGEIDGVLQVIGRNGSVTPIDHTPYNLVENLDYVVDDESQISGVVNTIQDSDEIEVSRGDLVDRSVRPGDTMEVVSGATSVIYTILRVIDPEHIRVKPKPIANESSVPMTITRRVLGKFIRFITGSFSKDNPAPPRLWSELTFFSNDPNIEANFGVLVGVRREDLERGTVTAPYKSVVAGLMFALTNGPVHENLRLAAQILLGLPFAENTGVITEINPNFRIRSDGSSLFGRILVDALDSNGDRLGITNVYLYPQGRQLVDQDNPGEFLPATPNEAGIAINPTTGVDYVVGDSVEQFAVLSKGVEIQDYLSSPESIDRFVQQGSLEALITQFHSFQLRINADVTTPSDVNQTTNFIQRAKPHYAKLSAGLLKIVEDTVEISDALIFGRELEWFDTPSYSLPMAVKFDQGSGDESFLTVEGVMYSSYLFGEDLVTTFSSLDVTSVIGGFITPGTGQSFDSPLIRSGDLLVISEGPNSGQYEVDTVPDDNTVTVLVGAFSTAVEQRFRIFRPVINPIFQTTAEVTNGSQFVELDEGLFSAGVSAGDTFAFHGLTVDASRRYTVTKVTPAIKEIEVTPAIEEPSGTYPNGIIRRDGIEDRFFGALEADQPHAAAYTSGSAAVVFSAGSSDLDTLAFLQKGDSIESDTNPGLFHEVLDWDPSSLTAYVTPKPAFTAGPTSPTRVHRLRRPETPISFEILDRIPDESLVLELQLPVGSSDLTTAISADVGTVSAEDFDALGIEPGDFLVILEGGDSNRDIGYGLGVFPIQELPTVTALRLTRPLTVTNPSGIRYGLQRRKTL